MSTWPDRRLLDLVGIELPIIQAPMAGANGAEMAAEVCAAGGLGSIPCAMLDAAGVRAEVAALRRATDRPFNLNFFCHDEPADGAEALRRWRERMLRYFTELGVEVPTEASAGRRAPFDAPMCDVVEDVRPAVVSFHFGLPGAALLARVKSAGVVVLSSATTVVEARWLEEHGCDAVIAQGAEAGGHRGMFLTDRVYTQPGTFALVPEVVDAVRVPVIAAGGIGDGRGIAAAFALGASGVQIGTAFLTTPESLVSEVHLSALRRAHADDTALTNVFTGRPARGIVNRMVRELGPINDSAPPFPLAAAVLGPLRGAAEAVGADDFTPLWSGQGVALCTMRTARELTSHLAESALGQLARLSGA